MHTEFRLNHRRANSCGTRVEIWWRMVYTVRVTFEVFVFFVIGVYYPKPTLNCNTLASIQLMNGMLMKLTTDNKEGNDQ